MNQLEPVLEIQGVSYSYGKNRVLDNVNLSLARGDFLALIGPNGGGKTTLIRLILGVLSPDCGTIQLFGKLANEVRALAGYIPQEVSSNVSFPISVMDAVLMGLSHKRGMFRPYTVEDREQVGEILLELNLFNLADRQIGELSGGQRQKVLLARALVARPLILFLDEPTASIDSTGQNEIYEYLKKLNDAGTTIILATHNIGAISTYIKSIACVNKYFHFHPDGIIDEEMLQDAFGCPVDLIAHGLPHRVLPKH